MPDFHARALAALRSARSSAPACRALVGLDGFVDTIVIPVGQRTGPGEAYTPITQIPEFAARIAAAAGKSTNLELYPVMDKLGGNGPILAAALLAGGTRITYVGPLGLPAPHAIPDALMSQEAKARPRYILYTGDQELEKRRLLLQLYNADISSLPPKLSSQCSELLSGGKEPASDNRDGRVCRIFMITQSGAEGISLFNTRQVHIMEPYWNNVRLQQVIGRAIRLCSHMNLPWEDRTVDVFTYLSVFTAQQKGEAKTMMMIDKSMTTDQMIFDIATKKQKLADGLFEIAQSSAADCEIHYHEHGEATQCFKFTEGSRPMFMYHPDWRKDLQASVRVAGK